MKPPNMLNQFVITTFIVTMLVAHGFSEKAVTIVDVKGHNEKPNYSGYIEDMINSSGMDLVTPGLPSTWRATSNGYVDEWQSKGGILDSGNSINSKIGWAVFDLGSSYTLTNLYIWDKRENSPGVTDYNVYWAVSPTVSVPDGPTDNSEVDYDFASGNWTLVNGSLLTLANKSSTPDPAQAVVSLGNVNARYVAIEIITGGASLVSLAEVGITEEDLTVPTLASTDFVDDRSGAAIESNQFVTYTVTFSEDMALASITSADFTNAGTSTIAITSLTNLTSACNVWNVVVQPSTAGSLQLQVPSGASLSDISSNALNTSSAIVDNTTITVNADVTNPTLASGNFVDDRSGSTVPTNVMITYTVTFSEDIDASTVTSADFSNAGISVISFGTITETAPGIFSIQVTPTSGGTLQFQVSSGGAITDLAGNSLDTSSAITDGTIISVDAIDPTLATTDILSNKNGTKIKKYALVTYTFTFSEDIDSSTVTTADFGNAGTASISIGNIVETSAGVFVVQVQPTSTGTLQIQVSIGAVIKDVAGNSLDTTAAITETNATSVFSRSSYLAAINDVTAHHRGQSATPGNGSITKAINGAGMTQTDSEDPSTWTRTSAAWADEWQSTAILSSGSSINNKIAWVAFDLGSTVGGLQELYIWNCAQSSTARIQEYNIYYSVNPGVSLPVASSTATDYDFSGTGWTKFNPSITMLLPSSVDANPQAIINLGSISGRYLAIEIITNYGNTSRAGLAEVGLTYESSVGTVIKFN